MYLPRPIQISCLALAMAVPLVGAAAAVTSPPPTTSFAEQLAIHEDGRRSDPNIYGTPSPDSATRPVIEIVTPRGFHWTDAGVGVVAALAVVLLALGVTVLVRSSRLLRA
jgi:hypothetical protein